ncbi:MULTISPECIES: histone deacetylase family protein [unclassified Halomonas]|uniref:histone deacetylase family protein n=1 Tax=unclassified Halomonas TaxID=2609666 RepID=UPI00099065CC|nr:MULTISPECIES: histone deacetylase family protein [unclassified Halomonas]AQU83438.1 acetylpolyamine amidohydrolase [Halomonas sp. 'Soap Lake \
MKCFYHADQAYHAPATFLLRGQPAPSPEGPLRSAMLSQGLEGIGLTLTAPAEADSLELRTRLGKIHTLRYLRFLETIYERWQALPNAAEFVAPNIHPCGGGHHYPRHPIGQAGWHLHDMACPLSATSFRGALASAATAQAAAEEVVKGAPSAYALCRPPGHHAGPERAGGFCLLNNAGLAATVLRERFAKVAIIDVDLHHGNGTQDIFYDRGDVWTGSLHADPSDFYPFFWGGADEQGSGEGEGANVNLPLPVGSDSDVYLDALAMLVDHLQQYSPEAVVVALGLDAHKDDPLAGLTVETEAFVDVGKRLAALSLPTVIIQEGGYPTKHLGDNLAAFMRGFQQA